MKRYLNSVEEVIKALKEGKQVKCDNDSCFELVDGFIVETQGNGEKVINAAIFLRTKDITFTPKNPSLLKFEVNRAYKNRKGEKMFLNYKIENGFNFLGTNDNYCTNSNGKYSPNEIHELDIIGYCE